MADAWMGWDIEYTAKFATVLADEGVLWLEEPLPPDRTESLAEVRQALGATKLATGEHGDSVEAFARLAATGGVDVLQPDVEWCGGLTAALRIAEIARDAGLELSPHLGGRVWGLHLVAASDVCRWAEWYVPADQPPDVLSGSPVAAGGLIPLSGEPGFGVTVNWAVVERFGRL
jgi:L-rhamnonate dehydratase